MIYISTDFVYSGEGERPWETDDAAGPISVYGRTKYEGEHNMLYNFIQRMIGIFLCALTHLSHKISGN